MRSSSSSISRRAAPRQTRALTEQRACLWGMEGREGAGSIRRRAVMSWKSVSASERERVHSFYPTHQKIGFNTVNVCRGFSGVHQIFVKPEVRLNPSPVNIKLF